MNKHLSLYKTTLTLGSILALTLIISATDESIYQKARSFFGIGQRVVLSSVTGEIIPQSYDTKVVKLKTSSGIFLEIYQKENNGFSLIQRFGLGPSDAYFSFYGKSSNLVLDDIDGDNLKEIIVPIYDQELVAHLAILKYDRQTKTFNRL